MGVDSPHRIFDFLHDGDLRFPGHGSGQLPLSGSCRVDSADSDVFLDQLPEALDVVGHLAHLRFDGVELVALYFTLSSLYLILNFTHLHQVS
jgi:hypothetical protein